VCVLTLKYLSVFPLYFEDMLFSKSYQKVNILMYFNIFIDIDDGLSFYIEHPKKNTVATYFKMFVKSCLFLLFMKVVHCQDLQDKKSLNSLI